ncbi:MAG: hypothetical protein IKC69_01175, partial [Clostridia bacterium]|nr:hypothetical protein [Clostridia bacterium]
MKRLKSCFFLVILALALSLFGTSALAEGGTETPPPPAEYELTLSGTEGFVIRYLDKTVTESVASIPAGTEVTVTLPPETGLKVKTWSATGADLESEEMKAERTEESIRFLMPAAPFLLSAECEARPTAIPILRGEE